MQTTATTTTYAIDAIAIPCPAAKTATRSKGNAFMKMLARKWDMIGVIAVMGASAFYAVGQLMTLAR